MEFRTKISNKINIIYNSNKCCSTVPRCFSNFEVFRIFTFDRQLSLGIIIKKKAIFLQWSGGKRKMIVALEGKRAKTDAFVEHRTRCKHDRRPPCNYSRKWFVVFFTANRKDFSWLVRTKLASRILRGIVTEKNNSTSFGPIRSWRFTNAFPRENCIFLESRVTLGTQTCSSIVSKTRFCVLEIRVRDIWLRVCEFIIVSCVW